MFRTLATFPKPLLACVDGDAVGVGCTILFHCDMVIASAKSTFRVPFVDLGLVPDAATSILAPERAAATPPPSGLLLPRRHADGGQKRRMSSASSPRSLPEKLP